MPAVRSSSNKAETSTLESILECENEKALINALKPLMESDDSSKAFFAKLEAKLKKLTQGKEGSLISILADRCEEKDLKVAFDFFDVDNNGRLSRKEMTNAMDAIGEKDVNLANSLRGLDFEQFKNLML